MVQTINQGTILYVLPFECVNFQQLGDECVGVAIESRNEFQTMPQVDSITLVKWPIKQLTMLDGSPLQRYVPLNGMHFELANVCNEDTNGDVANEVNIARTSAKRRYTFINRIQKQKP